MESTRQPKIRIAWWLALLQQILVRYVNVSDSWLKQVKAATRTGPVLFVLRNRSLIDFLCLQGLLRKHQLPEVGYVTGLSPLLFFPLLHMLFTLFRPKQHGSHTRLKTTLASGGSTVIFLRRPARRGAFGSRPVEEDSILAAVNIQGKQGYRVLALPTVFLWGESPFERMPSTMDFLFGSNEYPRLLRSIWLLLVRRSVHELQVGDPMDIAAIRHERQINDKALSTVIRAGVGKQIEIMRRAKLGALTKPSTRIMTEVQNSGRLRNQLKEIAFTDQIPKSEINARSWVIIKKLAADFRPRLVWIFARVMTLIWKRIYTGIDIPKDDIETIRRVIGEQATLLLPSHKSHIDYLVLSQIMKEHNLMMPHIAAGENLAFWPLGFLFRSSGAFFIRRRFFHDRFYTAVVSAYVRRLIQERYAIEIFIEGGRSRTGKLLRPKIGMLEMAVKAVAFSKRTDINILPIFIGYEHVIEESAYVAESGGRPKKAENISDLIRTTRVLFHKFGTLYVRTGTPFSISNLLKEQGLTHEELLDNNTRRRFATEVGLRSLREINRITVTTSSSILATVLLTHPFDTIDHDTLISLTRFLAEFLNIEEASQSRTVAGWLEDRSADKLNQATRVFLKTGRITTDKKSETRTYIIPKHQRRFLDYYKNNVVHFLVPASLIAGICLTNASPKNITLKYLSDKATLLCHLYQREFLLTMDSSNPSDASCRFTNALLSRTLDRLETAGIIVQTPSVVRVLDLSRMKFLSNILRNYHELYYAALLAAQEKNAQTVDVPLPIAQQQIAETRLNMGRFIKPEAHSALNQKSARETLSALKLIRAGKGNPFVSGGPGHRILTTLETLIKIDSSQTGLS